MGFLAVWFLGDVTNLVGALWAGLVPTVIALAVYFCIADTALIIQCLYYRQINISRTDHLEISYSQTDDANEPLLGPRVGEADPSDSYTRQARRSSASHPEQNGDAEPATHLVIQNHQQGAPTWVKNTVAVLAVCAIGATGWVILWKTGIWKPTIDEIEKPDVGSDSIGALVLGYISAICYLG